MNQCFGRIHTVYIWYIILLLVLLLLVAQHLTFHRGWRLNVRLWLPASLPSVFFRLAENPHSQNSPRGPMRISKEADLFVTSVRKKKEPFWRRSLGGFGFSLLFFPISMRFVFFLADFLKICGYFRIFTILEGNLFEGISVYLYFWGASDSGILQEKCKVGITNTNAATCPTEK